MVYNLIYKISIKLKTISQRLRNISLLLKCNEKKNFLSKFILCLRNDENNELCLYSKYLLKEIKITRFIDIGAHKGDFTNIFNLYFEDTLNFYLFEPHKNLNNHIIKNNHDILSKIEIFNFALGNTSEKKKLNYISTKKGLSSFSIYNDKLINTNRNEKYKSKIVEIKKLNDFDFINKKNVIYALKIDVQGFEVEVLEGASKILKYTDLIIIEASLIPTFQKKDQSINHIIHKMYKLNFILCYISDQNHHSHISNPERNLIFIKKNRINENNYKVNA